jgi:hypothetical protein
MPPETCIIPAARHHGDDDQHRVGRSAARLQTEHEDEDEHADATPDAEPDAARSRSHHDGAEHHQRLDGDQYAVHAKSS